MYPVHGEDNVPENYGHERQTRALRETLELRFPERLVTGNICMYWEQGAFDKYRAPDVLVCPNRPEGDPNDVYLAWKDKCADLVIEVGSKSTFAKDEGPKVNLYCLELNVKEYVYFRPHENSRRRSLRMWRRVGNDAESVQPNADGRFVSQSLNIEFGVDDDGELRLYERTGVLIPKPSEIKAHALAEGERAEIAWQHVQTERERAEQERQRADALEEELNRLREQLKSNGSKAAD